MPRRMNYRDVPDESDEEENWFGNADSKQKETVNYTANNSIPVRIDPTYQYDFSPMPEQAIENVWSLPKSLAGGKVHQCTLYNVTIF